MVCKEEFVSWFKESVSYKRVDLMCTLLNMCLPFELRFLGTYLEELGKRDFTELRETETRANNAVEVADAQCVSDKHTRRKLALYLSLLHSANYGCSNVLYKTLANFDFTEIQTLLTTNNSGAPSNEEENPLDELLLLYMLALNHPAFTYEQKSVFGSILMKLQDEEAKISYSPKPTALMCMKASMPPIYMPCPASPDSNTPGGGATHHYAAAIKPILLPSSAGLAANAGEAGKPMPMTEMGGPTYFHVTSYPNPGGPPTQNSVLYCSLPPPGLAQAVAASNAPSAAEYPCPQAPFMLPSMSGDVPCAAAAMAPGTVSGCLPAAANPEYSSPYRSPCASPYGSPVISRPGSPSWGNSGGQAAGTAYKCVPPGPPRHSSSSSTSSSCSGGSTGGYRSSRSTHPRNKQQTHNGAPEEMGIANSTEQLQQRLPNAEEQLHGMIANMSLANGICSRGDPRQDPPPHLREDKRHWVTSGMPPPPAHNSGSAGSSQSESPSPPRSPPQEETWDQCKEDAARWDKVPAGVPAQMMCAHSAAAQTQGGPPRGHIISSTVMRRPQDMKGGVLNRRPAPNMTSAMPLAVFPTAQGMQPLRASTGAIFPANTTFLTSSAVFSTMMPHHTSGPASFPPFTPNGITSPPPEIMYAVPPSSQTSPPPYQVQQQQQFAPAKTSSPPPSFMPYPLTYPPPPSANAKMTCYNCGGSNHRGADCREPSIEEVMRRGQYRLDFASPQTSLEQQSLPPQSASSSSSGGGNNGGSSSSGSGINAPPPSHK